MSFSFYDLFELAQIRAIEAAISPNAESIYRIRCRDYSQRFHTPLHMVMNELDPMIVLQTLYEDKYTPASVEEELEELIEVLQKIRDPENYRKFSKEETEDLVDNVLNREIARLAKKKPPTQQTIEREIKVAEAKPKSGSMDFSSLEKLESMSESNKSFED